MPLADNKIVHKAVLRAKKLVKQILQTDAELQQLAADWQGEPKQAYARWVAAQGTNLDGALIDGTIEAEMNTVITEHHELSTRIQAALDRLKEVQ